MGALLLGEGMKQDRRSDRVKEYLFYVSAALLALAALIAVDPDARLAFLSVLMIGQTICGIRHRYGGQAVVYFIATYVMFEVISPLNLNILRNHTVLFAPFCMCVYAASVVVGRYGFALDPPRGNSRRERIGTILLCAIVLLYLVCATSSSTFLSGPYPIFGSEYRIVVSITSAIAIVLIAMWFIPWLGFVLKAFDRIGILICRKTRSRRLDFAGLLFMGLLPGLAYLWLFSPGIMSEDSFVQWDQAIGRTPLSDWHPYMHTLLIRALANIHASPIMLPLLQIALSAFIYASWGTFLIRRGARRGYIYVLLLLFSSAPIHAMLNISLWKDVLYTLALAHLTLQYAKIIAYRGGYFARVHNIASFVISTIVVSSVRHNGFIVGISSVISLAVCAVAWARSGQYRGKGIIPNLCKGMLALLLSEAVIAWVMPGVMNVAPNARGTAYPTFLSPLGSLAKDKAIIDPDTMAVMKGIMPLERWESQYGRYSVGGYIWDDGGLFIPNAGKLSMAEVFALYLKTLLRHPEYVIADRMNQTSLLWNITDVDIEIYSLAYTHWKDGAEHPLTTHNSAGRMLIKFLQRYNELIFRVGVYSLILVLLLYYILVKKCYRLCVLYIPIIANTVSLMLVMPSQDYRFVYYVFELAPFVMTYVLLEIKKQGERLDHQRPTPHGCDAIKSAATGRVAAI